MGSPVPAAALVQPTPAEEGPGFEVDSVLFTFEILKMSARTVLNEIIKVNNHNGNKVRVVSSDRPRPSSQSSFNYHCPLTTKHIVEGPTVYSITFKSPSFLRKDSSSSWRIPGHKLEQNEFEAIAFRSSADNRSIAVNDNRSWTHRCTAHGGVHGRHGAGGGVVP
jgi:hypothetical protein